MNPTNIIVIPIVERMNPVIIMGSYRSLWNSGKANEKMIAKTGPEIYRSKKGMNDGIRQFLPWPTMMFRSRRSWFPYLLATKHVWIEGKMKPTE